MQYVYVLTNIYVPDLVKFGFSTRDPSDRAAELSAPTGVPGRWVVHHYWEVEDGYAVEQAIFKRLVQHRLERQEFFRMEPGDAVQTISRELRVVGTNPIEKARREEETQSRLRQAHVEKRERERQDSMARKAAIEERRKFVVAEIEQAQAPVRSAMSKSDNTAFKVVTVAVFALAFFANEAKGVAAALLAGVGWVVLCYVFPIIPISIGLMKDDSKFHAQLKDVESRVLASHGLTSLTDLDAPADVRRYG
jgi:hypothetical protein